MNAVLSPEDALGRIPGWEDAGIHELRGGLTNRTFLVESAGRLGVLKVDRTIRTSPYNARIEEARIQGIAADRDLANRVLYVDDTVYLTEYVDGAVWTRKDLDDEDKLVQLARALRELHALPLTGRFFDARAAAQQYLNKLGEAVAVKAREHVEIIEHLRLPQHLCCCHNDLVVSNILSAPHICFLDWEYACDNDLFFDLATVVSHHELSNQQAQLLLDAYFDGDGARWHSQLAAQVRLYAALHWLWAAAEASPTDNE